MKFIKTNIVILLAVTLLLCASGCSNLKLANIPFINSSKQQVASQSEAQPTPVTGTLTVHYIDVGQADCILIQQDTHTMLIDAGNNDDETLIADYLKKQGISNFEYVIGTHGHEDHIGSMDYIISNFDIGNIYLPEATANTKTYENVLKAIKNKGMAIKKPVVGDTFNLGDAVCTIMGPLGYDGSDLNTSSIVLKVVYGNNKFLFTGDAEVVNEQAMINQNLDLSADVLKVGHHGSSSSTSAEFLNKVKPRYAIVSVGKDNDYGHPATQTLDRLKNYGVSTFRTDLNGTVVATSDGTTIAFNTEPVS